MATEPGVAPLAAVPGPNALVIFGASGDLTKRKLLPALYYLQRDGLLPEDFAVIGSARAALSTQEFRERLREEVGALLPEALDAAAWDRLARRIHFVPGSVDDAATYERLAARLADVEVQHRTRGNVLFYLSVGPDLFAPIVRRLHAAGLTQLEAARWRRVVVEKPFGRDLASARALNADLRAVLSERQIYRIDHYLGKETVQNLLVLRFANGIFEPIWNRRYVDHVQVTVSETLGVEKRGGYYERSGALRDMVPNHIFQLISLVAMEPPISFEADAVRDEQAKVVRAFAPFTPEDVLTRAVRGQYGPGTAGGKPLPAYRAEADVAPDSSTETFVALRLAIDNWRWTGVPFYLRVGKALDRRATEIVVQFRKPPLVLFRGTSVGDLTPNELAIHVQPDEGISLRFGAKVPGAGVKIGGVEMDFRYASRFGRNAATGYERLLHDAMIGDQTLFQRADMVEASWTVVDPILDLWHALPARSFPNYVAGTAGPAEADALLRRDGRAWRSVST